jgi:hypothetical protein
MQRLFCSLTTGEFEKLAYDFAENGIPHAFQNGVSGDDLLMDFIRR